MGLNNSSFAWENQVAHFAAAGYQVLVFDNRGVGHSETPAGRWTIKAMAADTSALLDAMGWTEERSIHLVGVSMGGMIALELVRRSPSSPYHVSIPARAQSDEFSQALLIPEHIATLSLTSTKSGASFDLPSLRAVTMFSRLLTGMFWNAEHAMSLVVDTLYPQAWLDAIDPEGKDNATRRGRVNKVSSDVPECSQSELTLTRQSRTSSGGTRSERCRALEASSANSTLSRAWIHFHNPSVNTDAHSDSHHRVTETQLALIAKTIPRVAIITGDDDALVNPARSQELHDMMEVGRVPFRPRSSSLSDTDVQRTSQGSTLKVVAGAGHALVSPYLLCACTARVLILLAPVAFSDQGGLQRLARVCVHRRCRHRVRVAYGICRSKVYGCPNGRVELAVLQLVGMMD